MLNYTHYGENSQSRQKGKHVSEMLSSHMGSLPASDFSEACPALL